MWRTEDLARGLSSRRGLKSGSGMPHSLHGIIPMEALSGSKASRSGIPHPMTLFPMKPEQGKTSSGGDSFKDLAEPLVPALYSFACSLAHNPHEAEDLVQEALLKALRGFSSFEPGSNFKAWVFRILRNTFLTSRTGLAALRTVSLEDEIGEGADHGTYPESIIDRQTPELNLIRLGDHAILQSTLERLPRDLLEVILLCEIEELKYKEIAAILEIPIGTVMSRIARARMWLRKELATGTPGPEVQA